MVQAKSQLFKARSEAKPVEVFSGIIRRTLGTSERLMLTEMTIPKGSGASEHTQPQDEIGYLISGGVRIRIGAESRDLVAGDSYCVPHGEAHELEALEDSVCIIVFAPPRPEYMD